MWYCFIQVIPSVTALKLRHQVRQHKTYWLNHTCYKYCANYCIKVHKYSTHMQPHCFTSHFISIGSSLVGSEVPETENNGVYFSFLSFSSSFFCHWTLLQPLEPYGKNVWNLAHWMWTVLWLFSLSFMSALEHSSATNGSTLEVCLCT